jgi:hypothetical protein
MKTLSRVPKAEEAPSEPPAQRALPETGQFRLQVDRQTKGSYPTFEAAHDAGLLIKQAHPIVQVAVYDVAQGQNKIVELAAGGDQ